MAYRGMGVVRNSDGTISVTVDPNAVSNLNFTPTPNPKAINYGAMPSPIPGMTQAEYDALQTDIGLLAPGSAIDSPDALQSTEIGAISERPILGTLPTSSWISKNWPYLAGGALALLFMSGGRRR